MKNNGDTANAVVLTGSCLCNPLFRYDGPAHGNDGAFDLKIDETGNVYVTGYSIGAAGNVYIAGYSFGGSSDHDFTTIKYNSAGARQWVARYNAPADSSDIINDMVLDNNGNIYVTGSSIGVNGFEDALTIKYSQGSPTVSLTQEQSAEVDEASVNETGAALPTQFDLAQNFPNPFNPSTAIRFDMPSSGRVKLSVYNLRGELVRTLVDGEIAAGNHTINFEMNGMASGIYFCKMDSAIHSF